MQYLAEYHRLVPYFISDEMRRDYSAVIGPLDHPSCLIRTNWATGRGRGSTRGSSCGSTDGGRRATFSIFHLN